MDGPQATHVLNAEICYNKVQYKEGLILYIYIYIIVVKGKLR